MKKSIIFGVLIVMIISFATTFYFQHQAFSEQKTTMKSNFAKQQKKSDKQLKELQNKNAELEKTIKTNDEKTNALQSELDSVKAEKEQTVATSQKTAEAPVEKNNDTVAPQTQQEEAIAPVVENTKEKTNASGQTYQERGAELKSKVDSGELKPRELFDILDSEFPQ
ncbi:hypothetical protein [Carnobacterium maltaromaticum]|uniref:hypothetical protein n=1 Tax=Carnobacterium maltaromaticum TaxID=2751 RepID=UPI00026C8A3E|nr:hypothetical protein [Carnobacterium maltaromaticum]